MGKEIVLCMQAIEPGKTHLIKEYFGEQLGSREGLDIQFREAGIHVESVFIHRKSDRDWLYFYLEVEDLDGILEDWRRSEDETTRMERRLVEETLVGGVDKYLDERAELVFSVSHPENR